MFFHKFQIRTPRKIILTRKVIRQVVIFLGGMPPPDVSVLVPESDPLDLGVGRPDVDAHHRIVRLAGRGHGRGRKGTPGAVVDVAAAASPSDTGDAKKCTGRFFDVFGLRRPSPGPGTVKNDSGRKTGPT